LGRYDDRQNRRDFWLATVFGLLIVACELVSIWLTTNGTWLARY
jgi:hypothetical protein